MVYSWCWLGVWVLAGWVWCGCIEVYEVVCGLGDVVDLQGVDDWCSGSWFGGFSVVYMARRSGSVFMCMRVVKVVGGQVCQRGERVAFWCVVCIGCMAVTDDCMCGLRVMIWVVSASG